MRELMAHKRIHEDAMTVNGRTMGENCRVAPKPDNDVIWSYDKPLVKDAGFLVLRGNLFDSAIMKTSVISKEFRDRYLINPRDPNAFEGRAIVFEGPEDYHHRIDDPALDIDEHCILFVRGTGPIGYPGGAEVVNMQPAGGLDQTRHPVPALHRRRPPVRHFGLTFDPQCHAGSRRRWRPCDPQTGDKVRIDLNKGSANILISEEELKRRRVELKAKGGFPIPANQTPWQELYRSTVGQQATGACMEFATRYHDIAGQVGVARDNQLVNSRRHCERSEAIQNLDGTLDCLVASLLAMTKENEKERTTMSDRLKGKRAFVTAAAVGIGPGQRHRFCARGRHGVCHRHRRKGLALLAKDGITEVARLDVRDSAAVAAMAKRVGPVDILLNAAGFVHHGTVLECSDEDWDFSFDLNVKSMHRTIRGFLPGMLEAGHGSIVNISSAAGVFKAAPNRYVYGATKAAVAALTRAVATDFITKGIRCNCICPGTIETPSMPAACSGRGPRRARDVRVATADGTARHRR